MNPISSDCAPNHLNCPVTGGRCWHDGTSIYASERVWPIVQSFLKSGEHDKIFLFLEREADCRFYTENKEEGDK